MATASAPAATAAPAASAAPAAAPAKKSTVPKDLIKKLASGDDSVTPPAAAPAAVAPVTPPAAAAVPADGTPPSAPRVRKVKPSDLPDIPPAAAPAAAPAMTAADVRAIVATGHPAAAPAIKPDDQQDFELAHFASRAHADKYADLPQKMTQWFGTRDEFVSKKATELGGRDTPEFRDFLNSGEFRKFVDEHAPKYQRGDGKKIYEEYIEERGAQRALSRIQPELEAVRLRQHQIEQAPIINNVVTQGLAVLLSDQSQAKDPALEEFVKNPHQFVQTNEVEGEIIVRHANFFRGAMDEMMRIGNGLVDLSKVTQPSPTQQWIDQFVVRLEGELEKRHPNGIQQADGKILVSDSQFQRLRNARAQNIGSYRRLLPAEIVGAIGAEGNKEIKKSLAEQRVRLERSGFRRHAAAPAAPGNGTRPASSSAPASPMAAASAGRGAGAGVPATNEKWFEKYLKG